MTDHIAEPGHLSKIISSVYMLRPHKHPKLNACLWSLMLFTSACFGLAHFFNKKSSKKRSLAPPLAKELELDCNCTHPSTYCDNSDSNHTECFSLTNHSQIILNACLHLLDEYCNDYDTSYLACAAFTVASLLFFCAICAVLGVMYTYAEKEGHARERSISQLEANNLNALTELQQHYEPGTKIKTLEQAKNFLFHLPTKIPESPKMTQYKNDMEAYQHIREEIEQEKSKLHKKFSNIYPTFMFYKTQNAKIEGLECVFR